MNELERWIEENQQSENCILHTLHIWGMIPESCKRAHDVHYVDLGPVLDFLRHTTPYKPEPLAEFGRIYG